MSKTSRRRASELTRAVLRKMYEIRGLRLTPEEAEQVRNTLFKTAENIVGYIGLAQFKFDDPVAVGDEPELDLEALAKEHLEKIDDIYCDHHACTHDVCFDPFDDNNECDSSHHNRLYKLPSEL